MSQQHYIHILIKTKIKHTSIYISSILVSSQVQAAALDEMFHQGEASALRYHKALLLMEGLSQLLTEQDDILSVSKCKYTRRKPMPTQHGPDLLS